RPPGDATRLDGEEINVWDDPWLSHCEQFRPMGPAPEALQSLKVSDLLLPETKEWDLAKIKLTLPFHKDQIPGIQPSRMKAADELISLKNTTGEYSTRSGYLIQLEARTAEAPTNQVAAPDWLANVWNVKTLEIVKVLFGDPYTMLYNNPKKKRDEPFSNTSFEASQRTKLDMGRSNESSRGAKHNHYHSTLKLL
ncbi:hypothetical protein HID58_095918, partial [Brassica napus]